MSRDLETPDELYERDAGTSIAEKRGKRSWRGESTFCKLYLYEL